jgi:hypothetical protein
MYIYHTFWASTMLRPQSCRDCGRQIGVSTGLRPARLSHITFNNSFRDTSRAASRFARCDVCRQSSRLENPPKPKVPRERRYCRDCGNPLTPPATYIRCDDCRSARSRVAQQWMIITQSATASFDPSFNSLQLPTGRKQKSLPKQVPQKRTCHSLPLSPRTNRQRTTDLERVQQVIRQALAFLRDEYETHLHASNVFPPEMSWAGLAV